MNRIKKALAVVSVLSVLILATGCDQSKESLQRDAEFTKICHDNGGRVEYVGLSLNDIHCYFDTTQGK